jgi:hypothetical protein
MPAPPPPGHQSPCACQSRRKPDKSEPPCPAQSCRFHRPDQTLQFPVRNSARQAQGPPAVQPDLNQGRATARPIRWAIANLDRNEGRGRGLGTDQATGTVVETPLVNLLPGYIVGTGNLRNPGPGSPGPAQDLQLLLVAPTTPTLAPRQNLDPFHSIIPFATSVTTSLRT